MLDDQCGLVAVNYCPFFADYTIETAHFRKMKSAVKFGDGRRINRLLFVDGDRLAVHVSGDTYCGLPREVFDIYKKWLNKLLLSE